MHGNKKLLFVPMVGGRGKGPIYRTLALAHAAKSQFEIKFLCKQEFLTIVNEQGFEGWIDVEPITKNAQGKFVAWDDAAYAMGLCEDEFVKTAVSHQLKIVSEYKPDVIFTEYNITILLVAQILNIPIFSTVNWADVSEFSLPEIDCTINNVDAIKPYNNLLSEHGYETFESVSRLVTSIPHLVAPTIYELQPELSSYNVTYVGELLNRSVEEAKISEVFDDGNIYVYFTSADMSTKEWLRVIIRELQDLRRTIYVVSNEEVYGCLKTYDESELLNFVFKSHFPSLAVMKTSSVVLHPGTANIISGALLQGVPSIMVPMLDGERLYNAKGVVKNQCGCIMNGTSFFQEGALKREIEKIISSNMNVHAKKFGDKVRIAGGPNAVLKLLLDILS